MRLVVATAIWGVLVLTILTLTQWTSSDPGYWGVLILSFPVGMIVGSFVPKKK